MSKWWKEHCICISSPSLAVADKRGKRHAMRAHKPQAVWPVSDWLNPHYVGTMSAFGYIENLA